MLVQCSLRAGGMQAWMLEDCKYVEISMYTQFLAAEDSPVQSYAAWDTTCSKPCHVPAKPERGRKRACALQHACLSATQITCIFCAVQ